MQGTDGVKVSEPAGLRVAAADNFTRQAQETRTEMNTLGNPSPQDCKQGDNTKIRKIELCLYRLRQSLPVTHGSGLSFLQLWPQPGSIHSSHPLTSNSHWPFLCSPADARPWASLLFSSSRMRPLSLALTAELTHLLTAWK